MTEQADPVLRPLLSLRYSSISYCYPSPPTSAPNPSAASAGTGTSCPGPSGGVAGFKQVIYLGFVSPQHLQANIGRFCVDGAALRTVWISHLQELFTSEKDWNSGCLFYHFSPCRSLIT